MLNCSSHCESSKSRDVLFPCAGVKASSTPANFIDDRYVIGVPTSTIPGQVFSGTSTRSGDLLSVLIKSMMAAGGAEEAQKLHISLVAEVILELKESGTVLLE